MAKVKYQHRLYTEELECRQMLAALDPAFGTGGFTISSLGADERGTTMGYLIDPVNANAEPLMTVVGGFQRNPAQRFPDSGQPELVFFDPNGQIAGGIGINGVRTAPVGLGDSRIAGMASYRQNGNSYIVTAGYTEVSGNDLNYIPGLTLSPGNPFAVFSDTRDFFLEDIGSTLEVFAGSANSAPGEYIIQDVQQVNGVGVAFLSASPVTNELIIIGGGEWMIQDPVIAIRPSTDMLISRYVLSLTGQVDLDPTFGNAGTGNVIIPIASGVNNRDFAYAIAVDQQNRTIAAGYSQNPDGDFDFSAVRLTSTGALDPSFGPSTASPGRVLIDINSDDFANAVHVNVDGDIMLAGSSNGASSPSLTFVKLTTAGLLDIAFDSDGTLVVPKSTGGSGFINDIEEYPATTAGGIGGFYIATGTNTGTNTNTVLLRLNDETGELDPTFRGNGIVRLDLGAGQEDWGNSVALQPTATANTFAIVVGGSIEVANEGFNMFVARFESSGSDDTTFNAGSFLFIVPLQDAATADRDDYGATISVSPYNDPADPVDQFDIFISGSSAFNAADQFDIVIAAVLGAPSLQSPNVVSAVSRFVVEGDSGSSSVVIDLILDKTALGPISVQYATQNGTATSGPDFVGKTGTVSFSTGSTKRTVTVQVKGNTQYQANRSFTLALTSVNGADSGSGATITIRDNDGTWQNVETPEDADADGDVEPSDVLKLIDDVNRNGIRQLVQAASTPALFADVTGDTLVSPADVLAVIDRVNRTITSSGDSLQTVFSSMTASGFLASTESDAGTELSEVDFPDQWIVGWCPVGPHSADPPTKTAETVSSVAASRETPEESVSAVDSALEAYSPDVNRSDASDSGNEEELSDLYELIASDSLS